MKILKSGLALITCLIIMTVSLSIPVEAKEDPLADWQPKFDPSKAEYKYLLSCVGHPAIEGVAVVFRIRYNVWKKSKDKNK